MSFHMPLPYGPAPSPDKPMAKAHPSFQGVHSLVISSGWHWGVGNTDRNGAVDSRIQANCPSPSSNCFRTERRIIWLLAILFCFFCVFLWWFEWQILESQVSILNPECEGNHNASCPGGGDTGMQKHYSTLWWRKNTHSHTRSYLRETTTVQILQKVAKQETNKGT